MGYLDGGGGWGKGRMYPGFLTDVSGERVVIRTKFDLSNSAENCICKRRDNCAEKIDFLII